MPRGYAPPPLNPPPPTPPFRWLSEGQSLSHGERLLAGLGVIVVLLIAVSFVNWAGWWTLLIPAAVAACYLLGLCAEALMHLADKHADAKHKRTHDLEEWRRQHIES